MRHYLQWHVVYLLMPCAGMLLPRSTWKRVPDQRRHDRSKRNNIRCELSPWYNILYPQITRNVSVNSRLDPEESRFFFQYMILHHQKNHTDEDNKVSEYLDDSPKKVWQQDTIIAKDPRQEFLRNVISDIDHPGSKKLGKLNLDMNQYLGGQCFIVK